MPPPSGIELQPGAQGLDFANYFVSYGYLYHQKDMLQDRGRMTAYRNAILQNASCFEGKVVLDVGAGSGVLSIWAAMAGAKRVYAVEATSMAQHARRLVQQNGVQDVVVVLEGYMEAQELPEKVDLIVSEWMGYFLLREAMYDSVLAARDKWLKPGGAMYPSHAFLRMAPLCSALYGSRLAEFDEEVSQWGEFSSWMLDGNGINVSGLTGFFAREQQEYLLQSAQWCQLRQSEVIGDEFSVSEFDLHTTTTKELASFSTSFRSVISEDALLNAFGGWFDTDFNGSAAEPAPKPVTLTTAPESATHWAQQVFLVHPPLLVEVGDTLEGIVKVARQKLNHRLLWVQLTLTHSRAGVGQVGPERTLNFRID